MTDYLPEEVVIEILASLPVRTLLRFRCVCKSWQYLITSSSFVAHHLNVSTAKNNCLILFDLHVRLSSGLMHRFFAYRGDNFPDSFVEELHCRFDNLSYFRTHHSGSCNGVLCVSDGSGVVVLWNPSIKKAITVPAPPIYDSGSHNYSFGLGFDSTTDDYKLVGIVNLNWRSPYSSSSLVQVYSVSNECWKMIPNIDMHCLIEGFKFAFAFGACHWCARESDEGSIFIVAFALGNEVFRKMAAPDCLVVNHFSFVTLGVIHGFFSLVASEKETEGQRHSIWVMKEYGNTSTWSKLYEIQSVEPDMPKVAFGVNGKVIIDSQETLFSTDPMAKHHRKICPDFKSRLSGRIRLWIFDTYVESLVLLNETSGYVEGLAIGSKVSETSKVKYCSPAAPVEEIDPDSLDGVSAMFDEEDDSDAGLLSGQPSKEEKNKTPIRQHT